MSLFPYELGRSRAGDDIRISAFFRLSGYNTAEHE